LSITYNKREIFITRTREDIDVSRLFLHWGDTWWDTTSVGDKKAVFFTSSYPDGHDFKYLLTYYGLLIRIPTEPLRWDGDGSEIQDWEEFHDPSKVVFRAVGYESGMIRLYWYDLFTGELYPIIETSYNGGEYEFYDFDDVWFNSKDNIGFIGRIQNDVGQEYSINLDGGGLKLAPNGKTVYY
jgi:hypothetical protein